MAHRGASKVEQENTTVAFRRALEMGANAVELDVRRCATGELVVHHDAKLSDGRAIIATKITELPDYVPTLNEALNDCGSLWVNIEIKNDSAEPDFDPTEQIARDLVEFLKKRGSIEKWLISSFRRETVDEVRKIMPQLKTAWLVMTIDNAELEIVAKQMADQGHYAIHPWVTSLTEQVVAVFHKHGLKVNTWTCDNPSRIKELIDWQVDGICTNVPDLALQVVARPR